MPYFRRTVGWFIVLPRNKETSGITWVNPAKSPEAAIMHPDVPGNRASEEKMRRGLKFSIAKSAKGSININQTPFEEFMLDSDFSEEDLPCEDFDFWRGMSLPKLPPMGLGSPDVRLAMDDK